MRCDGECQKWFSLEAKPQSMFHCSYGRAKLKEQGENSDDANKTFQPPPNGHCSSKGRWTLQKQKPGLTSIQNHVGLIHYHQVMLLKSLPISNEDSDSRKGILEVWVKTIHHKRQLGAGNDLSLKPRTSTLLKHCFSQAQHLWAQDRKVVLLSQCLSSSSPILFPSYPLHLSTFMPNCHLTKTSFRTQHF